jgi:hypothetical protein
MRETPTGKFGCAGILQKGRPFFTEGNEGNEEEMAVQANSG